MPGTFRCRIRSLGFFSLLIAVHTPPGLSPWIASSALRFSRRVCTDFLSSCLSLLVRYASSSLILSLVSVSGSFVRALMSFLRSRVCVFILWCVTLVQALVNALISLLKSCQRHCGLDRFQSTCLILMSLRSSWSLTPQAMSVSMSVSSQCLGRECPSSFPYYWSVFWCILHYYKPVVCGDW